MAHHQSFESLDVFKEATVLCDDIWNIIINTSLKNDYKLRE